MAAHRTQTLVLIGHGMVGHRLLEALAERGALADPAVPDGPGWRVTVLAEEDVPAYDRVHLSSVFTGTGPDQLGLSTPEFLAGHGIDLRLGDPAERIDPAARTVTTTSGRVVAYDALVLATGSYPFVPPIPGADAPGCFTYRTLYDVDALTRYAERAGTGVVIGGGLLGLEAAGALRTLGLATHVVEFAPRLMPLQVDDGGAAALRATIESMGVAVHTGVGAAEVETDADGKARRLRLSNGERLPADVVVFSAGVRPRDRLAREAGFAVGDRGGVVVDERCRTTDPYVYAIGECAQTSDGRVYGLVAPGYQMAEAVADQLAGSGATVFTGADTSTKLKLLGADVASFGDPFAAGAQATEIVFSDGREGVYKKLLLGPEGQLLGGILVGDAEAYGSLKPHAGRRLPAPPEAFLLPASAAGAAPPGADALPDDAVVCSCHNVTKGAVAGAVAEHGLTDIGGIKRRTKAGTGCGGCVNTLQAVLDAAGVERARGLCEHFPELGRPEVYELIRTEHIRSFTELLERYGSAGAGGSGGAGSGCTVCKPVVANVLGTLAPELGLRHVLDGEQAALQDSNDLFLANLQKDGTYSVVPRVPGGEITAEQLIALGEVARDHGLYSKITGGQRIDLFGARKEELPVVWRKLIAAGFESGQAYGKSLRTVKSCVGSRFCRFGQGDSVQLAIDLELRYRGLRAPHKIKGGVSGCLRECAEARGKDIGVIATAGGWNLYVCGNGGTDPRHAELLASDLSAAELFALIDRFLMYYVRTGERLERTSAWLERLGGGTARLREVLIEDSLGICAELEEQLERHVAAYRDEWRAVLDDPVALARFEPHVAGVEFLEPGRGRAAVLADGTEAALFRDGDGEVYAVGNRDPFSGADVMANGIMGRRDGVPVVASPLHKQEFDLRTGACLDDPDVALPVLPVPTARP
ncbi:MULTISPECIES: nitrite reductase large subunit NirB [Streptomyces]|uniref:assimilatory sulfite reductase (ferredoxin) n=1 Tax=Streptomyces venezuelae (strain ATCC 10712 / CBS 650.69 / DSM 40230 / JCM 4526 / NBRC 13096 / PD 04745) TaxID=953739 RepID=F2R7P6_STRVP|nr:nitrite reductase large subunit NirB [Streptomyces venezuelae]APE22192.1 nitrite reductase [Streptomyces venezuelae]QER99576.1 nitrite reductase large subunit [Streptomyces venezuelae ATCC 10712]CCA56331.1 Nitrite reductase large subunit [Streptomyces venezuelae ATCC 10712]